MYCTRYIHVIHLHFFILARFKEIVDNFLADNADNGEVFFVLKMY